MAYRELELTLLSAQNLKNVNLFTSMAVYAVVSISGDPLTRQSTAPDTYGGRNPRWNATFRFAVPPTAAAASAAGASLHVLLRAERFLGDRDVGEVVVPLADILAGAPTAGPQPTQVASYQVRKVHRWEPHGVLNVSYRLGPVVAAVKPPYYAPVVGVPQQRSPPPAKPDAYDRSPPPLPPQIIVCRLPTPTPTTTTISPPARPNTSPAGNWATQGSYASAAASIASAIASPAGKEDRSRPTWSQLGEQASPVAGHRLLAHPSTTASPPPSWPATGRH